MSIAIHWFRQDLRLRDNPALTQAARSGYVLPIYILDDENARAHKMGGASRWWLHHSLLTLNKSLDGNLSVYRGNPTKILPQLIKRHNAKLICWNRCYEPWRRARDEKLKKDLSQLRVEVKSTNGSLLWEPWTVHKHDGMPYKVFTPFYRNGCLKAPFPRMPLPLPPKLSLINDRQYALQIESLNLLPINPWYKQLVPHWQIGEEGAQNQLNRFLENGLRYYKEGRNFPAKPYVSKLSPHLHFGEISPNQLWYAARMRQNDKGDDPNVEHFCFELAWREFSYSLLYHFPDLPIKNLYSKFDAFPWRNEAEPLTRWQQGKTGYPIVDAGMRELWQTGSMHNRVRMIVGSFLVKNLLVHWHHGERWFWDCLVDADLASNSASWQWIAGCGADAAPYFRVFNPITQGHRFDPQGDYTRHFIPELKSLPNQYLFNPWEAPKEILTKAGIILGEDYPEPIVDIKSSRQRALEAFSFMKNTARD